MTTTWTDLLFLFCLTVAVAVLHLAERALALSRRSTLEHSARVGSARAAAAIALSGQPSRHEAAVRLVITLASMLGGFVAGARMGPRIGGWLASRGVPDGIASALGIGMAVLGVTFASLVLAYEVPRRLAARRPESFAMLFAWPLRLLARLLTPIARLIGGTASVLLRVLRIRGDVDRPMTEDEIKLLVREGMNAGVLDADAQEMILRIFRLAERRAGSLMTPRNEIVWIDSNDTTDEMRQKISASPHTSFPVCDGSLDNVLGVVRVKQLLIHGFAERAPALRGRLTMPLFIFDGTKGTKVLETMRKDGEHFAVVLDEFGSVQGVLTMTDLLEAIVGDLTGADASLEPRAVQRSDGSWSLDGSLTPEELGDLPGFSKLPRGGYHTLAGFLISRLGHIPNVAEVLEWEDLRFEVADLDGKRIHRVMVSKRQ